MIKISQLNKLIILSLITFMLTSCGGGGGSSSNNAVEDPADDTITVGNIGNLSYSPASCSEADQKAFLYKAMHDVYYWSSQTPHLDYTTYSSQDSLMDDLIQDRWSYIVSKDVHNAYYAGDNIGLGINLVENTATNELFLYHVYPGSPADIAGLQRGYSITSVNGYTAAQMLSNSSIYNEAFGPSEIGETVDIDYIDNSGSHRPPQ